MARILFFIIINPRLREGEGTVARSAYSAVRRTGQRRAERAQETPHITHTRRTKTTGAYSHSATRAAHTATHTTTYKHNRNNKTTCHTKALDDELDGSAGGRESECPRRPAPPPACSHHQTTCEATVHQTTCEATVHLAAEAESTHARSRRHTAPPRV